jgi:hypothetical protein
MATWITITESWSLPLVALLIPAVLAWLMLRPYRKARRYEHRGEHDRALAYYQRQLALLNRFPWLDGMYRVFRYDTRPYTLRELLLLDIAELQLRLHQPELAVNALWRCLGFNDANMDALELLDHIRTTASEHRIIGW